MTATNRDQLLWYVATYQAPLRDLQIHGLALFMILGVSQRLLPRLFGLPATTSRRAAIALTMLTLAVLGESLLFVAYRWSHNHILAACLLAPWLLLAGGVVLLVWPWRLWRPLPLPDRRSGKFIRAAFAWLTLSLLMLLLLPLYQAISGIAFSHAYYGAIRHAITVGFVSLMIMGMSARLVPSLLGVDPASLSRLWGPFLLINLGCFLRVSLQIGTDWHPAFSPVVGVSGLVEVAALAWWGLPLGGMLLRGRGRVPATLPV